MLYLTLLFIALVLTFVFNLGTWIVAILLRVRLDEITVGMGVRLFGIHIRHTQLNIGLLPLGGYCRPADYSEYPGVKPAPNELRTKSFLVQIILNLSGIMSSLVLSILLIGVQDFLSTLNVIAIGFAKVFLLQNEVIALGKDPGLISLLGFSAIPFALLNLVPFADSTGDRLAKLIILQFAHNGDTALQLYKTLKRALLLLLLVVLLLNVIK